MLHLLSSTLPLLPTMALLLRLTQFKSGHFLSKTQFLESMKILFTISTLPTPPQFLGLETDQKFTVNNVMKNLNQVSMDITIGFLDTGIWPESKSFDDLGMKPIPRRWRGKCESGVNFNSSLCNKKLIGDYTFSNGVPRAGNLSDGETNSLRDENGQGTYTASIASRSSVANASLYGYAIGTARGMAPRARVAIYKVCWRVGCYGFDILAGMECTILDGVHILLLSIGFGQREYFEDPVSIGSFSAVQKGIFVSGSAGNSGLMVASVNNLAPRLTTVGVVTIDRDQLNTTDYK